MFRAVRTWADEIGARGGAAERRWHSFAPQAPGVYARQVRITSFWAKGYRSLHDFRIDDLGPFNVFYGKNGSGKSNILAGMETLFRVLAHRTRPEASFKDPGKPVGVDWIGHFIRPYDRCNFERTPRMLLGATLHWTERDQTENRGWPRFTELSVEITYEWEPNRLSITRLRSDDVDLLHLGVQDPENAAFLAIMFEFDAGYHIDLTWRVQTFIHQFAHYAFALVGADRYMHTEHADDDDDMDLSALFSAGRLKEALRRAREYHDPVVRRRYKQFEALMASKPLERPPMEITRSRKAQRLELVEIIDDAVYGSREVPVDLAGLGIAQIYHIAAHAVLRASRAVAIEEPEAHLHAPSTGIQLRQVLERLVSDGYIDQLFIATHSNLFDLDPEKYYDVSLDGENGTVVKARPLSEIDEHHLYEPGPAKHALAGFLRYMDDDAIVYRTSDGQPVSVREMLDMLQRDDPLAVEFLRDVHGAAVRAVRVQSKKADQ